MHIVRVHNESKELFEDLLNNLKIPICKAHLISEGANGNYGTYINKDVKVYGFMDAEKSLYDQLKEEVRKDNAASKTYKDFSVSEFFF
ncbi:MULTISPECIES: hypothetical protein [Citrobacter]|uniref:hypothetical protein n=1 Tax=Citrobacter TaxID=544 RepID=UPI00214D17C9|nr:MULTISPECIES: hypothetical protein [Citrobacter]EKT9263591.1 hypothetical protein [Citrobacter freundii]EKU4728207.1 hypothetical protein [Citrobacter freundii]EKV2291010.1 hypothetical protein [Citrobacter freundii]EKW0767740.1 hypothetical protein [Citrobacter freundii]MCR3679840.1 hypothetical protein [Citrobacter freundii]